jgi:hypothetical protein
MVRRHFLKLAFGFAAGAAVLAAHRPQDSGAFFLLPYLRASQPKYHAAAVSARFASEL